MELLSLLRRWQCREGVPIAYSIRLEKFLAARD